MTDAEFYIIDGVKHPRVSRILDVVHDKGLESFQRGKGFRFVDNLFTEKANFGKRVHQVIESDLKGDLENSAVEMLGKRQPELFEYYQGFRKGRSMIDRVIHSEKTLSSKKNNYAGTIDIIHKDMRGGIVMADFKTGKKIFKHLLQMGAYWGLCKENKINLDCSELWYLGKYSLDIVHVEDIEKYFYLFICALNLYREAEGWK